MKQEIKNCQNCQKDFTIEPEDFNFYEKIKVPPPTFCPECRLQRRMTWRNDWHLFKKKDARTGEEIFSFLPEESPVKIYDRDYWISDAWNPMEYGRKYDFERPFFDQFKDLFHKVPLSAHSMYSVVNSHYCTNASNLKNCYLVRGASYTEDSAYLIWDVASRECFDSHMTQRCELSYGNVNTIACYKTFFSVNCESCQEMILDKDCVGCNSCIASVGLRNKSYYIFNQPYSKEEYVKKLNELNLGSYQAFQILKDRAYKHWLNYPQKYIHGRQNVKVSGDYIYESKNAENCFRVTGIEDSKFIQNITFGPVRDCYDYSSFGQNAELVYESVVTGLGASNIKFCNQAYPNVKNLTYCAFCGHSSDLFGCVSLQKKQYCILNKQYTEEEYEKLMPKIIEQMKKAGEYGEFFPASLAPFPYKITSAYEFFPLNEKEAKTKGFQWYETAKQNYKITLKNKDIPDDIKNTDKDILNQAIECAHGESCQHECTGVFRLIKTEFDFCKRMNIPLPRLCANCRHYERVLLRNSPKLYHRQCMCDSAGSSSTTTSHGHKGRCPNEFETSYAPDPRYAEGSSEASRPEKIYCKKCYQQEVY